MSQPSQDAFAAEVSHWSDIPGWFHWREGQEEAVRTFSEKSTFVEVGCYLGRSLCSLADVVRNSGPGLHGDRGRHLSWQRGGRTSQ